MKQKAIYESDQSKNKLNKPAKKLSEDGGSNKGEEFSWNEPKT